MSRQTQIKWLDQPADHDYPAAISYLSLLLPLGMAQKIGQTLKKAPITNFKAKDVIRASALPLLDASNFHVKKDRKIIKAGGGLSPVLLVRDPAHGKLLVADGYHRVCAVYSLDEDAVIPCKIVG
jgi:hypothetical protein